MKTSKPSTPAQSRPTNPVVGNAAGETVGTGSGTTPSSDWTAEMTLSPTTGGSGGSGGSGATAHAAEPAGTAAPGEAATAPEGVPISMKPSGDHHRGKAVESKRGQR